MCTDESGRSSGCLKKYSLEELQELVVEMYKAMSKALKEDKNIDALLGDFSRQKAAKKQKKEPEPADLEWLSHAVPTFVEYAMKQYYFAPNRVLEKLKSQRRTLSFSSA